MAGGRDYTAVVQPFQGTERMVEQLFPTRTFPSRRERFGTYQDIYNNNYFVTSFLYGWLQGNDQEDGAYKTGGPRQSGFYGELGKEPDDTAAADAVFVEEYISGVTNQLKDGNSLKHGFKPGAYDVVGEYARRIYDVDYNKRRASVAINPDFQAYYTGLYTTVELASKAALETAESFSNIRKKFTNNFGGITEEDAEKCWDQFRRRWHIREEDFDEVKDIATSFIIRQLGVLPEETDEDMRKQLRDPLWLDGLSSDIINAPGFKEDPLDKILYSTNMTKIVNNFKMLLWRLPFARAWLAITSSKDTGSTAHTVFGVAAGVTVAGVTGSVVAGAAAGALAEQVSKSQGDSEFDFANSEVTKLWKW
jgi:hypothetical protein